MEEGNEMRCHEVIFFCQFDISLIFSFHLFTFPVHPTGFSFACFPGILAIFILLSSHNKNNNETFIPSFNSSPIFPFYLLPSPMHPTVFCFCFFPGFLAIFILLFNVSTSCLSIIYTHRNIFRVWLD